MWLTCILIFGLVAGFPDNVYQSKYRWIHGGDINIGAILSIHSSISLFKCTDTIKYIRNVKNVEALNFAVNEINARSDILPNLRLGFYVLDDCLSPSIALARAIQFMPPEIRFKDLAKVPDSETSVNFNQSFYNVVGVIGTYSSKLSVAVADVLSLFKLPQISHTATSDVLSDKSRFPYFFRMVPPDRYQAKAIASLLKHFNWTHVSIVYSDGSYGRDGVKELRNTFQTMNDGVCVENTMDIAHNAQEADITIIIETLNHDKNSRVVVAFVEIEDAFLISRMLEKASLIDRFIWVGSDGLSLMLQESHNMCAVFPSSFSFHPHTSNITKFADHLKEVLSSTGINSIANPWLQEIIQQKNTSQDLRHLFESDTNNIAANFVDSFLIDSIYVLAQALDNVVRKHCTPNKADIAECVSKIGIYEELKYFRLNMSLGELQFNENGDRMTKYDIRQCHGKIGNQPPMLQHVGFWEMNNQKLHVNFDNLVWSTPILPISSCNKPCTEIVGTVYYFTKQTCCHVCVLCKVNEIVVDNATRCEMCPDLYWPDNKTRTKCNPISPFFFSIRDSVSIGLCAAAISGMLCCLFISVILIKYRNRHVIKCFSLEVSSIILFGTLLTYSLTGSFTLQPNASNCFVNHVGFSLTFTIIYAPLLVKTNRIYRIFNAGRRTTRKPCFISTTCQVMFSMMLILCQVTIVIVSTSLEPPKVTLEMPQRSRKFVELFCKLPKAGLLSSLSYNLVLVAFCTFYAFKTRKLPDNYNESRYIAFCVVTTLLIWITFVPTYFTTSQAAAKTTILVVSLLLNASVTVVCLFIPRMYSLYKSLKENTANSGHHYKDFRIVKHVVQRKHPSDCKALQHNADQFSHVARVSINNSDLVSQEVSNALITLTTRPSFNLKDVE